LIKAVHFTNVEEMFSYEERYKVYKAKTRITFYSIFNMSSCRKPEIQNDLPKLTQIKWICYFLTNGGQLCWFYHV